MDDYDGDDLEDIADRVYAGANKSALKHGFSHLAEVTACDCVDAPDPEDVTAAALLDMLELGLSAEQADKAVAAAAIAYNVCAVIQAIGEAALAPEMGEEEN